MNIILAGNPNVGKSTLFNALTGLKQHTGNWSGKTVECAKGTYIYHNQKILIEDIPGCYSMVAKSFEESIAKRAIVTSGKSCVVVVCDAHSLERNLSLLLEVCEAASNVALCVNFADEAEKKGIKPDFEKLEKILHIPVIRINARKRKGFDELMTKSLSEGKKKPFRVSYGKHIEKAVSILSEELDNYGISVNVRYTALRLMENDTEMWEFVKNEIDIKKQSTLMLYCAYTKAMNYLESRGISQEELIQNIHRSIAGAAHSIYTKTVNVSGKPYSHTEIYADKFLTGKISGFFVMLLLMGVVFYITLKGSNLVSGFLSKVLFSLEMPLYHRMIELGSSEFMANMFIHGGYKVLAWVVSVMLPPMAIFFPLFTVLEDVGYLPRMAFNVDRVFKKCNTCGKQALTTCMGFGCNAVGITGARIIDSPRERLIAILTNSFIPCNGRFPALICLITVFFAGCRQGMVASLWLVLFVMIGIGASLLISFILSKTLLKGVSSSYALELPHFRKPEFGQIVIRSLLNRTLKILLRAAVVAFPSGIVIWLLSNVKIGENEIVSYMITFIHPLGKAMGLDGVMLTAFILGSVANEIVLPIAFMLYGCEFVTDIGIMQAASLLSAAGWTKTTALCALLFFIMHWPCTTSALAVKKETGSIKWMLISVIIPTLCGIAVCMAVNMISNLI